MDFLLDDMDTVTLSNEGVAMQVMRVGSAEPLRDLDGNPVTITILGPDSDRYRTLARQQVQARLKRAGEKRSDDESWEMADHDALELIVACTVSWSGIYDRERKPIPYSPGAARELYTRFPSIRDQVDSFMTNRANFLRGSRMNSPPSSVSEQN